MSKTTLVTALYNIGRDKLKGKNAQRDFSKYLSWFKYILAMNVPMVIFIPRELHDYIEEYRQQKYTTKVVIRDFKDLEAYKYHDRIQSVIEEMVREPNSDGIIPNHFSECPEFITARYETIIYSKFDFLKEVSEENPFGSDYFVWLDAGTFYEAPPFDCTLPWPDQYKMRILGDKFLVSDYSFDVNDKTPLMNKRNYLRLNKNDICAFVMGGSKIAIDRIHNLFWKEVESALEMGVINNEQHILQLMVLENPEYYYSWYRTRYKYPKLPIPLRDRMIPSELAIGTYIGEDYHITDDLLLLTVATKEISHYKIWENTAKKYGYKYEILGRKETWKNFGTKITLFHSRLRTVAEPYVALTDCTDLFFCGCSRELLDKFLSTKRDIIVGGEPKIWYPGGNHTISEIEAAFKLYPNSGFIMGKTEDVRKLMEIHLTYVDDQVACYDTIIEGKFPLVIDNDSLLVGNIPKYEGIDTEMYFTYDKKFGRYTHRDTKEMPAVLHFPGKNWDSMRKYYETLNETETTSDNRWIWILLIIGIGIILGYLIYRYNRGKPGV